MLPAGMSPASIKVWNDSVARADSIARAGRLVLAAGRSWCGWWAWRRGAGSQHGGSAGHHSHHHRDGREAPRREDPRRPAAWHHGWHVERQARLRRAEDRLRPQRRRHRARQRPEARRSVRGDRRAQRPRRLRQVAVDHDSLRAHGADPPPAQMASGNLLPLTPEQASTLPQGQRRLAPEDPPARLDSINNGADDDGSGSMAVLEIAEAIAAMPVKPKRSTLFVWHTGEEAGLHRVGVLHAQPDGADGLDRRAAQHRHDRSRARGGRPRWRRRLRRRRRLVLRLSKDLGETVRRRTRSRPNAVLDDRFDVRRSAPGQRVAVDRLQQHLRPQRPLSTTPRKGIPIAFFFTGLHGDYHQRTDEPEFIDYPHYARITNFIRDLTVEVGNVQKRPALDGICTRR